MQHEANDQYSLRGRVFKRIREDILSGKYEQNEELRENTIAQELGVSRTPVREALRQLELEGLVTIIPNKGAYVNGISEKDIHDIYVIRSYMEGLCARWACEKMTESCLKDLDEVVELTEFYIRKGNTEQIVELDNRFHELLYRACDSKWLDHMLTDFHHYVERVRMKSLADPKRAEKSNEEHRAIVEALRKRDGAEAESLAHEHIIRTIFDHSQKGL